MDKINTNKISVPMVYAHKIFTIFLRPTKMTKRVVNWSYVRTDVHGNK